MIILISMLCVAFFMLNFKPLYRHFVQSTRLKKEQTAQQQIPQQQYANQTGKFYNCRCIVK